MPDVVLCSEVISCGSNILDLEEFPLYFRFVQFDKL